MNRKKRTVAIVAVLLVLMICLPCWRINCQVEQARKDQALIVAIKAKNATQAMELVEEGASANAHDTGEPPSFGQALRQFLSHFGRMATQQIEPYHPSALALAVQRIDPDGGSSAQNERLALALLDHGANPNDRGVMVVLGPSDPAPVLSQACAFQRPALVRKLLEKGANPNVSEPGGFTPLMWADAESARLLIAHGANVDAVDSGGQTALMSAVDRDDLQVSQALLEHGAKVSLKDKSGFTAITMSWLDRRTKHGFFMRPNHRKILALLRRYSAK